MGRMKDGNKKVRWILIEAANTASRTDDRLRKFYTRLVKKDTRTLNPFLTLNWSLSQS
jgi:transposase